MTDLAGADPATRYGDRRGRRLPLLVAVVVVALAGLAWLLWVILVHGRPLVTSELVAYDVTDEHAVRATVSVVRREEGVVADCLLRAQAPDHSVVGELSFTVDDEEPATALVTQEIRTEREATTVTLLGCRAEGQARRR